MRLLSKEGEPLRCRIEHVDVVSAPFTALSYEWGEPCKLFWIDVVDANGQSSGTVSLTANLYNTLCNLRDSHADITKTFWIDQICINQQDDTERGQQVNMMGKIYSAAERVVS